MYYVSSFIVVGLCCVDSDVNPATAVTACNRMLLAGLLKPVGHDGEFTGNALLFRLTAHERSAFRFSEKSASSLPDSFDCKAF